MVYMAATVNASRVISVIRRTTFFSRIAFLHFFDDAIGEFQEIHFNLDAWYVFHFCIGHLVKRSSRFRNYFSCKMMVFEIKNFKWIVPYVAKW